MARMGDWKGRLGHDPVPYLLLSGNPVILHFTRRDLLDENPGPVRRLRELPLAQSLLRKQRPDGSWKYPGRVACETEDYSQLETFRSLGILVENFGMDKRVPAISKAVAFLFSRQTGEGDFRGVYGRQYTPNYTGAILELIVKAGYARDPHVARCFEWLLSMRQDDGGWALPCITTGDGLNHKTMNGPLIQPDRTKPFSHGATGMVLRAFAAHPKYKRSKEAHHAGRLLASRFFQRDGPYIGRHTPDFWLRFSYPFWFTDLLSSLDSLARMGFCPDEPDIARGLEWLRKAQRPDGSWKTRLLRTGGGDTDRWVALGICRVFKRFYG